LGQGVLAHAQLACDGDGSAHGVEDVAIRVELKARVQVGVAPLDAQQLSGLAAVAGKAATALARAGERGDLRAGD
jgi:hypothetical protein